MLGLSILAGSKRFQIAGDDWERGRSTVHDALYMFCDVVIEHLLPMTTRFPVGEEAVRGAREFQRISEIP